MDVRADGQATRKRANTPTIAMRANAANEQLLARRRRRALTANLAANVVSKQEPTGGRRCVACYWLKIGRRRRRKRARRVSISCSRPAAAPLARSDKQTNKLGRNSNATQSRNATQRNGLIRTNSVRHFRRQTRTCPWSGLAGASARGIAHKCLRN